MARKTLPNPYGCADCGIDRDRHGRQYSFNCPTNVWVKPSDWKILLRMQARRDLRKAAAS